MAKRKGDGEKVISEIIDEKLVVSVMKKFICTKAADPEELKWFKVEDGVDYFATTLGSAAGVFFKNKYDPRSEGVKYIKPLAKDQKEEATAIPEVISEKVGNKKVVKKTGNTVEYPDVRSMFDKYNLDEFTEIDIPVDDLKDFISIHEAMNKVSKIGGMYNTAEIVLASSQRMLLSLYDSPLRLEWNYDFHEELPEGFLIRGYHYDYDLMTSVFKSLNDLKVDSIKMYMKDRDSPLFFVGKTVSYLFKFAVNKKLTN
jgi:hypothetical protein